MTRRFWVLLFWALVILCFSSSQARIIRVPLDFPTVQEGLNAAGDEDTVLVEPGVYRENIVWPAKSSIKLFANEQSPPDSTFLEPGEVVNAPIITIEAAGAMIDSTTVIRGFVFRNGSAEDGAAISCTAVAPSIGDAVCGNRFELNSATGYGGAIYCASSSPIIVNNSFHDCTANYGGAIAVVGRSWPKIRHNFISGCIANEGGGIYCSEAEIIGNNLIYCRAHGFPGGALHIASGHAVVESTGVSFSTCMGIVCSSGSPTIKNSTIYANQRVGIYIDSGSTALVEGNLIEGNAGGIEIWGSSPTIRGNFIRQNDVGGRIGGGIRVEHGAPIIERNQITGNNSAYEAGGIYCCGDSSIIDSNNISSNTAPRGGGVFLCCNSHAIVYGDTIYGNFSDGILIWDSQPGIVNCVISNNRESGIRLGLLPQEFKNKGMLNNQTALQESVIVESCTITNNTRYGVWNESSSQPLRISWSSFSGNRDYGVFNSTQSVVDARLNCWGHPTGPGGAGPGLGDRVSENVLYYPWLANGYAIASSTRLDPIAYNNSRKIVRDECPPYYKVFYTSGDGVWVTMTSNPIHGPWTDPIEIWPIELLHKSTHPAVAIEYNGPNFGGVPYSKIHLVWAEHIPDETAPGEIYYSFSADGGFTWSGPLNLSNSPDIASEHPAIAVDGTGVVHVVWEEQVLIGGPSIFYVNNSHGWIDPIVISAGLYLPSVFPTIAANYTYKFGEMPPLPPDDRVHIAWTEFTELVAGVSPWIAYRSYDPMSGWIPPLDQYPEDATVGRGGAMASIIAYPYGFVQRGAAVVWQWPYYFEDPPISPCDIYFNARYDTWGIPTRVSGDLPPDMNPSWYASLSVQVGPFLHNLDADTLWCVWEEWNVPEPGKSEIYSAYSPDCGQTWTFYLNLSQTPFNLSRYPSLAYQKGVTFDGLYDLAWTEILTDLHLQYSSDIYYIGATSLKDSIYAGVEPREPITTSPIVAISYPNPATDKVTFAVSITKADRIDLAIFDVTGREVVSLSNSETKAGTHLITWDAKDSNGNKVSSGVYWYVAKGAQGSTKGKIVILR